MFFTKRKKSDAKLIDIVAKISDTGYTFWNINDDLGKAAEVVMRSSPHVLMAYGYARRAAVAAMYLQGLVDRDAYSHVAAIFKALQLQTGHSVEFQERAGAESIDFMQSYNNQICGLLVKKIIQIAQEYEVPSGLRSDSELIAALISTIFEEQEEGKQKNNHFYLRDASREGLSRPIHIDFDSYEPVFKMGNKTLPNPCTFLVTVDSPAFTPRGLTCRVSGINHKLSPQGVRDGVVAHVLMVKYEDDGSIERVHVQLLEDGRVVGQLITGGRCKEIKNLERVYFMAGDTVFLDGMGEPYDSDNQPRPTREQELFLERERNQMINSILDS